MVFFICGMFYIRSFQYSGMVWHLVAIARSRLFPILAVSHNLEQDNLPLTQAQTHFQLTTISSRFEIILSSSTRFWLSRSVCEIVCSERGILSLITFVSVVASYYCILFLMERENRSVK